MEKKQYTWRTNNRSKQARLDFFLISENFLIDTENVCLETGYRTDHSMVILKFKGPTTRKTKSFWKFNNSLLKDKEYVKIVKQVIEQVKTQYRDISTQQTENEDIKFTITDQLFLDVLLMEIRGKTISYSSFKKKKIDKTEEKLVKEISQMEQDINTNNQILEEKRNELKRIRENKLNGLMIRSRAKWLDQGEKVSKYFCNMENRNYISKCMPDLIKSDGNKTQNEYEIIEETKNFYKNLYDAKPVRNIDLNHILNFSDIPKLSEKQKQNMEGLITQEEALVSLKNMKNNKSPGSDGFSAEFLKFFWSDIGHFVVRSVNNSFQKGELSNTQKEGIITCIPKGDKDKKYLKNWRPISLLNITYKIASACIANRIKKELPYLINEDQTGFISGRFIGENIRNLYDLFYYTEKNNIPGLLLLIDFEKAFDSVNWVFISKVFDFFNFGESIKKWIQVFYNNIKSCVIVNGQASEWFKIARGCRQGDPLSPYIFILCAEILAWLIRKNKNIKGIALRDKEYLISQYADDTSLTLDGTEKSLKTSLRVLKFYAEASGLHVNMEKTKVIWFGSNKGLEQTLCEQYNLCWEKGNFTVLGIKFSTDLSSMINTHYTGKNKRNKKPTNSMVKKNLDTTWKNRSDKKFSHSKNKPSLFNFTKPF